MRKDISSHGVRSGAFPRGIGGCDVQSRQFIGYSFSKSGVNLKSFSLGHIK